ncbi:MAG TPA: SRPBCC family protein [Jatrophihabitans sp.]|jgi:hypothetical protein|uniref:SRPBCC family protein n=1 Tax=Jatrophihabitans sp. TaxID=1932789 RepID=UPI002EEB2BDF
MPGEQKRMTEVHATMRADAARVFAELADGWAYVGWVVGASHIRDVDANWPEVGSKIHHKVGAWPVDVSDFTESLACEPDRRLLLRARGWPLGEATIEITLEERSPALTEVTIREAPSAGPGQWLDNPLLRLVLRLRNRETLRRLADRVEHRAFPLSA